METVRIDPALVPNRAWDEACRILRESITAALADPKLRAEYEAFKVRYAAEKAAREVGQ